MKINRRGFIQAATTAFAGLLATRAIRALDPELTTWDRRIKPGEIVRLDHPTRQLLNNFGIKGNEVKLRQLAMAAKEITPLDANELLEELRRAAARPLPSPATVIFSTQVALANYSKATGKRIEGLTDDERRQALMNEAIRLAEENGGQIRFRAKMFADWIE